MLFDKDLEGKDDIPFEDTLSKFSDERVQNNPREIRIACFPYKSLEHH